ncbi:DNA alkylation repair protein [Micromonospora rubida]|uniref:DNA alkylation repair protein n=1 Tax=Micromonospora rubida TaxID=2697657 RepID=A0ABW7STP5_9ACTN
MTTGKVPLKEQALNADRITRIAREIHAVLPRFDADGFIREVMADLPHLELKARIARTSQAMHDHLSVAGDEALEVLLRSLPPTPQAAGVTNDFGLHIYSPHSDYVARYWRTAQDLDRALGALQTFTRYFSAENAVRYFLNDFPEQTLNAVNSWAQDPDYRVRRLASESTRPKLPWSPRLTLPIDTGLPILEQLYADPSRYVTRSVANHLRDIAATDPDLVLATLTRWQTARHADDKQLAFIAREALKSRLKEGWPAAYQFLGYTHDAPVEVSAVRIQCTSLHAGESLVFNADLSASETLPLHVTYVISSRTQRGARREKVYFLCRTTAEPGRDLALAKSHHLRSTAGTTITPGRYALAIQVNGRRYPEAGFQVV